MADKMKSGATRSSVKSQPRHLVQTAAAALRDIILAREPGTQIGSLAEVGRMLGVGIVTVQQAARILEHEGLLDVRRGKGGGYYGMRPDEAALERSIAAYLRVHGTDYEDLRHILSLFDCDMIEAAARCGDPALHQEMRGLRDRIDLCRSGELRIGFETDFRTLLFRMNARPFFELLMRVTMGLYRTSPSRSLFPNFAGEDGAASWMAGKRRIVGAILQKDPALARFEAERNRQELLARTNI